MESCLKQQTSCWRYFDGFIESIENYKSRNKLYKLIRKWQPNKFAKAAEELDS